MNPVLHVGIDIGSTTIKAAVLSPCKELLWGTYVRHMSEIKKAVLSTLDEIQKRFPGHRITAAISGNGGMGLASRFQIPFYQEILAETKAVRTFIPDADVIIELGGEDEKNHLPEKWCRSADERRLCRRYRGLYRPHGLSAFYRCCRSGENWPSSLNTYILSLHAAAYSPKRMYRPCLMTGQPVTILPPPFSRQ